MKFSEIPQRLNQLLMQPDPIIINHVISVEGSDQKKTACYDIDVEVDDTLKQQMNNFLLSTTSQQEIAALDNKVKLTYMHLFSIISHTTKTLLKLINFTMDSLSITTIADS